MVVGRDKPPKLNSELVEVAEEILTLDTVAVRVALRVLLVRMVALPKFKAVRLEVKRPAGIPLPARAMVKVGFEAFETTAIAPLALPTTFGVKRILKVTLCPLFRLKGKFKPLKRNPAPVTVAFEIAIVELPEFVNTSCRVWLLPTCILPKLTLDGLAARVPGREAEVATPAVDIRQSANVNTTIRSRAVPGGDDMPQF
jgi:hypothetical protein